MSSLWFKILYHYILQQIVFFVNVFCVKTV